jgi:hypothetical protein
MRAVLTMSRYGEPRYIEELNDNECLIYGRCNYGRMIGDDINDLTAIDFEGGPYLNKGFNLKNLRSELGDLIIKKFVSDKRIQYPFWGYKIIIE